MSSSHVFEPCQRTDRTSNRLSFAQGGIGKGLVEILAQKGAEIASPVKSRRNSDYVIVPAQCARVLDQRQSSARVTSRARTGLSAA